MKSFDRIGRLLARHRRREAWAGTVRWGAWVLAGHVALLAVLGWMSVRRPLSDAWLLAILATYAAYLILPFLYLFAWRRKGNSLRAAARNLDRANPGSPDPFQTSLSLENHGEETRRELDRLYSPNLDRLASPRASWLPRGQRIVLGAAAAAFVAAAWASGRAYDFIRRTAAPWEVLSSLPILRFAVEPPPAAMGMGDTAVIRGAVANRMPGQDIYAHVRTGAGEKRYRLTPSAVPDPAGDSGAAGERSGVGPRNGDGPRDEDGPRKEDFEFAFGPVEEDFAVHFSADNGRSQAYKVSALALPFLESVRAVVMPPAYTRLRTDTLPPGVANFPVLPGSTVRWLVRANRDLERLVWEARDSAGVRSDTLPGARDFAVEREVRRPLEYAFALEDRQGIQSRKAVPHRVDLLPDHPPEVELLEPSQDGVLDRDFRLPLAFRVKDDYGVTSLKLVWRLLSDGAVKAEGRRDGRDWLQQAASGLVHTTWSLDSLELRPENVLEFHLVAMDNDTVNGPKTARSAVRALRLPSIREVLEESRRQEQSALANLKSAIQRERQLERKLEREARQPREEGPPPLAGYEINRIMVDSPREQLRRAEAALDHAEKALARKAGQGGEGQADKERKSPPAQTAVKELQDFLRKSGPGMPQGNQSVLPLEERRKNLENLIESQKEQERRLAKLNGQLAKEPKDPRRPDLTRTQLDYAAKELQRNLEAQQDLKKLFQEEAYQEKSRRDLLEQSAQEQMRMAEDARKAIEDIQKTMEQSQKNGLLTPELADKMQKIQELLKEVLPDSLQKLMEQKLSGQDVDPRELRDQLQKVLGKPGELGENLSRALAMLEQLRDRKRMQELRQALGELEDRERDLARRIASGKGGPQSLEAEQKAIQEDMQRAMEDFARQAEGRKALEEAARDLEDGPARQDMQEAREALSHAGKESQGAAKASRAKASASAKSAADKLAAMQGSLAEAMAGMESSVDLAVANELLHESLGLSRLQLLIRTGAARRAAEGWEDDEPALYAKVAQTSQWLNERVKTFAATIPFIGQALSTEARNFHLAAREAARNYTWEAGEKSLHYNQNLSRELLKLLKMAGQGGGEGAGGSSAGGSPGGKDGKGGKGGEGGSGGDLSGQLKGMSGKQMAINQATQQLLQAMLEGRRMGGGQPGGGQSGGMPGDMQPGGQQPGGQQPGGSMGQGGRPGGRQGGGQGDGGGEGGEPGGNGSLPGLGNRQGELGERLETLAEALGEEAGGGGATKVRKLAQEARELEESMREGRLAPEEIRKRQERFQTRMLEAANALEERGMSEERKAEAGKGGPKEMAESAGAGEGRLLRLLREARRSARELRLDESQRRVLDEYYESLLTR